MFRKFLFLVFLSQSALLWAQSKDSSQESAQSSQKPANNALTLRADAGEIDFKNGTAVYTGNVEIAQGGMKVTGQQVTAKTDGESALQHVEATGKPATFRYQPPNEPEIIGEANRLTYDLKKQLLTLEGNAKIRQGDHQTTAQSLSYDLKREKLRSQNVHIIYQVPAKK